MKTTADDPNPTAGYLYKEVTSIFSSLYTVILWMNTCNTIFQGSTETAISKSIQQQK